MKKTFLLITSLLSVAVHLSAQQAVIHTEALKLLAQNAAVKNAKNAAYRDLIEQVQEAKDDMLKAKVALEEVHRLTYNSLTEVHDGIKEAKKFYYTLQSINRIRKQLGHATELATGIKIFGGWSEIWGRDEHGNKYVVGKTPIWKNPILPLHYKYINLINERVVNLVAFVEEFIQNQKKEGGVIGGVGGGIIGTAQKGGNIVSNIVRERFLSDVYQKVYALEMIVNSYVYGIQTVKWQSDANNIIPYEMFINDNKLILNRIKSKLKF